MASGPGPIMVEASRARRRLRELCLDMGRKITSGAVPQGVDADDSYLSSCLDRLNIWAGSLGVFQKGEASLDSRLSSHILVREVVRLLRQLNQLISDFQSILDGERTQAIWTKGSTQICAAEFSDSDSLLDDEEESALGLPDHVPEPDGSDDIVTESKDLQLSINESITGLLRLSVQVHKSSSKSKFARSSLDQDYAVGPDISHVRDFFPHAAANDALVERLGKANAQRRQWLGYRRRHREKLSVDLSGPGGERLPPLIGAGGGDDEPAVVSPVDGQPSEYLPSLTGTKATTFRSRATPTVISQSVIPDTVFGRSSRATASEPRLMVPDPPSDLVLGQPYFCRYCCNVIEISGKNAWHKHVHADLSSYSCTFERCDEIFFESKHKWWAHENESHRKRWSCGICRSPWPNLAAMADHLRTAHPDQVPEHQAEAVAHRFGRPLAHIDAADCPLCDYPNVLRHRGGYTDQEIRQVPNEKFGRHLGRHLEQLALFVLPYNDLADDEHEASDTGGGGEDSGSDRDASSSGGMRLLVSVPDLVEKLSEVAARQNNRDPEILAQPPDLAMRWQPPQDFTPPAEDFETDEASLLPARQEPLYGGDLHTAGWTRGLGDRKEGFCARCPAAHWVNIPDGSYRFHLTYFHGVPESGVPLPRPSTIRPVEGRAGVWEGYCDACEGWRVLKKTGRGWSWYRHWLNDHTEILKERTDRTRSGASPEVVGVRERPPGGGARPPATDAESLDEMARTVVSDRPTDNELIRRRLESLAKDDRPRAMEQLLAQLASTRSDDEIRTLINHVADGASRSLLAVSASHGMSRVVNLLLDLGADPNALGPDGRTALDCAADAGYFTIAQQLIDGGADASRASILKKILSDEREYAGENVEEAAAAERSGPSPQINPDTLAPLGRAAYEGDMDEAQALLGSEGTAPSRCDVEEGGAGVGCSPFLLGSIRGHFGVMDRLLAHGANINATSPLGWTPLMLAAKREDEPCVSFLLSRGADVNHLSPDRWTALAEAASRRSTRITALLLEAGADPEVRAQSDWTPLMYAAYRGDIEAVDLLLHAGASFDEISARDETAMLLAAASGSPVVVRRLLDAGCSPEPIWSRAEPAPAALVASKGITENGEGEGEARCVAVVEDPPAVTGSQQRIERTYKVGWTPLMVACQVGSLDIVAQLLDAGANPEPRSPMLKTALEIAKENGRTELVDYLQERMGIP
ncbi:ankyrin repeat-containing domain protein [Lasiosphaeria hispida]|uniref:Ankyrin repeat-containing domain protein n=1 Tax=Lasiosphaeria hispida TaxID=260671 RepID=A0AAJ0HXS9_9PEZI|nr:ankyrin repeat-containing domain protein [Lasiosphaeria hispida]